MNGFRKEFITIQIQRLLRICVLSVICLFGITAYADNEQTETDEDTIEITVVEEIAAEDLSEAQVPLASFHDVPSSHALRHAVLGASAVCAGGFYILYCHSYEKKLKVLRQEAAEAETSLREIYRS